MVTAASLMGGWAARQGMSQRLSTLRQLRLGLELMQGEMELDMPAMETLFDRVGRQLEGFVGEFFVGTAAQMAAVTGRPPQTAMKIQLEQQPLNLGPQETNLLLELSGCLGRYDLNGQGRALELYKNRLDLEIAQREGALRQKARTSMTASVCAGLALIVILL